MIGHACCVMGHACCVMGHACGMKGHACGMMGYAHDVMGHACGCDMAWNLLFSFKYACRSNHQRQSDLEASRSPHHPISPMLPE